MSKIMVVATKNQGKVREIAEMFRRRGIGVKSLADYPEIPDIEENGRTFTENARIKAETVAYRLGVPVLADDSGLVVEALGGEPGVRSARYAGEGAKDHENNAKLLRDLASKLTFPSMRLGVGHPPVWSKAAYVCSLVLTDPTQRQSILFEGSCEGYILGEARGSGGFGYDPYFYLPEYSQTMAELPLEEKNKISHRALAFKQMMELLF